MGSYDNIVKLEEMRRRLEEGDYLSAEKIMDTLDRRRINNVSDLGLIAEVCIKNERYDEATELLINLYKKTRTRKILFHLIDISIKRKDTEDAERYLEEYETIAPQDFDKYIFRYKIDKLKGEPFEKLIEPLRTLKKTEYIEQWAYELAKLYYKAGMEKECINECSDIVLWFGEGTYVEKARMLRAYYSGETDKDRMIEELKRRANQGSNKMTPEGAETFVHKQEQELNRKEADVKRKSVEQELWEPESIVHEAKEEGFEENESLEQEPEEQKFKEQESKGQDSEVQDSEGRNSVGQDSEGQDSEGQDSEGQDSEGQGLYSQEEGFERGDGRHIEETIVEQKDHNSVEASVDKECTEEFLDSLSVDIQNIMSEEHPDVNTIYEFDPNAANKDVSASDAAEREVEETFYQLLSEEDMKEEDNSLQRMAEELGFDPEDIFGNFLNDPSVKKQLVKSLESILYDKPQSIYLIITGSIGSGKTTLAKKISLFLNKSGKLSSSKVAKIRAGKLNNIDIGAKRDKLKGGCLVIENASELKRETSDKIIELSREFHGDLAVILEENRKNINKLFQENPKLMDLFKNRIHL